MAEGSAAIEDLIVSKRLRRAPREYDRASQTAIARSDWPVAASAGSPAKPSNTSLQTAKIACPTTTSAPCALWDRRFEYGRRKYIQLLHEAFDPLAAVRCARTPLERRKVTK